LIIARNDTGCSAGPGRCREAGPEKIFHDPNHRRALPEFFRQGSFAFLPFAVAVGEPEAFFTAKAVFQSIESFAEHQKLQKIIEKKKRIREQERNKSCPFAAAEIGPVRFEMNPDFPDEDKQKISQQYAETVHQQVVEIRCPQREHLQKFDGKRKSDSP
jgi:hypothetical protein